MSEAVELEDAVERTPARAERSVALGWSLFGLACLVFGLTFIVALAYLQLD